MSTIEAERVRGADRRRWPRVEVSLPVRLIDSDGGFTVLSGRTCDICVGGLRAHVNGPLSGEVEATVCIDLTSERTLVCEAMVAGGGPVEDGWEYRLAFRNLEPDEIAALELVVDSAS